MTRGYGLSHSPAPRSRLFIKHILYSGVANLFYCLLFDLLRKTHLCAERQNNGGNLFSSLSVLTDQCIPLRGKPPVSKGRNNPKPLQQTVQRTPISSVQMVSLLSEPTNSSNDEDTKRIGKWQRFYSSLKQR